MGPQLGSFHLYHIRERNAKSNSQHLVCIKGELTEVRAHKMYLPVWKISGSRVNRI